MLLIIVLLVGSSVIAHAENKNNVIYISINGASNSVINALIDKQKTPTLAKLKEDGGITTLKYPKLSSGTDALMEVIMGDRPIALSAAIRARSHGISVGLIWTPSKKGPKLGPRVQGIKKSFNTILAETPRSTTEITQEALNFIETTPGNFVLFMNYVDAENQAYQYREGGQYYSKSIQAIDKEIAKILSKLAKQKREDVTTIILTTNHSFKPNSSTPDYNTALWLISNNQQIITSSPSRFRRNILYLFSN